MVLEKETVLFKTGQQFPAEILKQIDDPPRGRQI
jgi:hypothetical protein